VGLLDKQCKHTYTTKYHRIVQTSCVTAIPAQPAILDLLINCIQYMSQCKKKRKLKKEGKSKEKRTNGEMKKY